jgi:hypothetical protein
MKGQVLIENDNVVDGRGEVTRGWKKLTDKEFVLSLPNIW